MSPDTVARLADDLSREVRELRQQQALVQGSLLAGHGGTLLGYPVEITLHWPEGRPFGMSDEDLRRLGDEMIACAGGTEAGQ